jgi:hypothetical protein
MAVCEASDLRIAVLDAEALEETVVTKLSDR